MNPLIPGVLSGKGFISQALPFFQEYRCKLASQALASRLPMALATSLSF